LRQFRSAHSLQVSFHRAPPLAELAETVKPAEVEQVGDDAFRIVSQPDQDPTDMLLRASVEHNWGLFQLAPTRASVEEVFVHLTRQDDIGEDAADPPETEISGTETPA
jgi:hypothetical protein